MREVPHDQRAFVVRGARDRRHVLDLGGAIAHMRKLDDGRVLVDRGGDLCGRHEARRQSHHARDAFDDVIVGGKIAALGEDGLARRPHARRGDQELEQVDRDRVGDDDLMRRGAEQWRELGADAPRRLVPAGLVPRADEAFAPFGSRSCARRAPRRPSAARPANCRRDSSRPRAARNAREHAPSGSARSRARQSERVSGMIGSRFV